MSVVVTGGTGLVGSALRHYRPDWVYLSSKDIDLTDKERTLETLTRLNPTVVIHLAANVGGLFKNAAQRLHMFNSNMLMNTNLLEATYQLGIKRVICCLSTCIFPDGLNRVLNESDLHLGEPHVSNFGYAYAKRMMEVQCRLYNETPGFHYQCIIPTNIYGPHDNFHLHDSHVIPGLIHKAWLAHSHGTTSTFKILGTGKPRRQFIYSYDLARIVIHIIDADIIEPLLICAPPVDTETTILDVAQLIGSYFDFSEVVPSEMSNVQNDGQQIKTASPSKLLSVLPESFQFTSLEKGIRETMDWFVQHYPNVRK